YSSSLACVASLGQGAQQPAPVPAPVPRTSGPVPPPATASSKPAPTGPVAPAPTSSANASTPRTTAAPPTPAAAAVPTSKASTNNGSSASTKNAAAIGVPIPANVLVQSPAATPASSSPTPVAKPVSAPTPPPPPPPAAASSSPSSPSSSSVPRSGSNAQPQNQSQAPVSSSTPKPTPTATTTTTTTTPPPNANAQQQNTSTASSTSTQNAASSPPPANPVSSPTSSSSSSSPAAAAPPPPQAKATNAASPTSAQTPAATQVQITPTKPAFVREKEEVETSTGTDIVSDKGKKDSKDGGVNVGLKLTSSQPYTNDELANAARLGRLLGNPYITWHIALMLVAYVGLLPVGVAFGRSRHRWHIPLQLAMVVCASIGYYLAFRHHDHGTSQRHGHHSTKRFFEKAPHVWLGILLLWLLALQTALGVMRKLLKMRWPDRDDNDNGDDDGAISQHARPLARMMRTLSSALSVCHRWLGGMHVFVVYLQILLGVVKMGHFCQADAARACWERYTIGSLLWWLAAVQLLALMAPRLFGRQWARRPWDMAALLLSGMILLASGYAYGELRPFGVIWMAGGIAGLLAHALKHDRLRHVRPVPLLMFAVTGSMLIYYGDALTVVAGLCVIGASMLSATADWMGGRRRRRHRSPYQHITGGHRMTKKRPRLCGHILLPSTRAMLRLAAAAGFLWSGILVMSSTEEWRRFLAMHGLHTATLLLLLGALSTLSMASILSLGALVSERTVAGAGRAQHSASTIALLPMRSSH
ncbi:hypothetical protein SYNPS1DRAFT_29507, partial [Syncephalis pseudoplumigaleata]